LGIGYNAFAGVRITSLDLGTSVTVIQGGAFSNANLLTGTLIIPNSVKNIEGGFERTSLSSLNLGNSVQFIGAAFTITGTLSIPDSVTQIDSYAFRGTLITSLILGSSLIQLRECFKDMTTLTETLSISNTVKYIDQFAFSRTSLTSLILGNSLLIIEGAAFAHTLISGIQSRL
jgi:hypothetical protein